MDNDDLTTIDTSLNELESKLSDLDTPSNEELAELEKEIMSEEHGLDTAAAADVKKAASSLFDALTLEPEAE